MARAPVVLIVSEHEWASRSLDTILGPRGYAVLRAYNGSQAVERAAANNPDAIFIERTLPDGSAPALCRRLIEEEAVGPTTPLIVTSSGPIPHEQRVEALRAGAWEVVSLPIDAEELVLRLSRYTRAKIESDRVMSGGLVDPDTGLYSRAGIIQRATEVVAAAERYGRPVACIIFDTEGDEGGATPVDAVADLVEVLRKSTRKSDILGRIGPGQFAVVAPDTEREGAEVVADRLRRQATRTGTSNPPRAGFFAISDFTAERLDADEFVLRAVHAAQQSRLN